MIERRRIVSHPGVYVKDAIEELGLTQSEFALRTGLSIKNVSTLVNGESNITFDVAIKLSLFFHNTVEGWLNLQTKYDLYQNQKQREEEYKEDWNIVKIIDKGFASRVLDIDITSDEKESVIDELRKAFNVATLQSLKHPDMYAFCKTSINKDIDEKTIILRNAWISLAEREARKENCGTFNKDYIVSNTRYLRSLTLKHPQEFSPLLMDFFKKAGVKFVILPFLSGSNVSGVTKWNSNDNSVLVAVNDCGKVADRIWFTIFHELGHAIQNHKRHMTISYKENQIEDQEEIEANEFAKNALLDKESYEQFIQKGDFSLRAINQFAFEQGVANFIVIGRLQKEEIIPWSKYQNQKLKYTVII